MGINVKYSDMRNELAVRVTQERDARERELRKRVLTGDLSLENYLMHYKGYREEDLPNLLPKFRKAIFEPKAA